MGLRAQEAEGAEGRVPMGKRDPNSHQLCVKSCLLLEWELTLGCFLPTETRFLTEVTEGKDLFWLTV